MSRQPGNGLIPRAWLVGDHWGNRRFDGRSRSLPASTPHRPAQKFRLLVLGLREPLPAAWGWSRDRLGRNWRRG